jgi:hypothetical protein
MVENTGQRPEGNPEEQPSQGHPVDEILGEHSSQSVSGLHGGPSAA